MKKIAGTLRIDLAQYRELEAFAKFGSDLDKATLQQLRRGERLVEVLKQKQYVPMNIETQVVIIYAASKGYLDQIPVKYLAKYEAEFLSEMENMHKDILNDILEKKDLTDDIVSRLNKVIQEFSERFKSTIK
jgi:F-type H+-transporting ATPase subunit alpha